MKILHVATGFPVSFPGGITNYVRTLARCQREMGLSVDILGGAGSTATPVHDFADQVFDFDGVASVFSMSLDRDDKAKTRWLQNLLARYDLIHFHMGYGLPTSFYEQEFKTPYIVSLHDYGYICPRIFMVDKWGTVCEHRNLDKCQSCVGVLEQINVLRAAAKRVGLSLPTISSSGVRRRAKRLDSFLSGAEKRLAVSRRVAQIFEAAVSGSNFDVVHIGNETAGKIPQRSTWKLSGRIRCCYIGTLNKDKGAEIFIELVKKLPNDRFEFVFWGRGEEKYIEALRGLGVSVNGAYTPERLKSILSEVDLGLVLPVWNDNGPQVLMEFINNGVPVLGTSMGGVPDFLNEQTGYLFNPTDGISSAVQWMLSLDEKSLQHMHSNISPLKNPLQHATELASIYKSIISERI